MKKCKAAKTCQQTLQGWVPYWEIELDRTCGLPAHFTWVSSLRGKLFLCRRHAKSVGLDKCAPIQPTDGAIAELRKAIQ